MRINYEAQSEDLQELAPRLVKVTLINDVTGLWRDDDSENAPHLIELAVTDITDSELYGWRANSDGVLDRVRIELRAIKELFVLRTALDTNIGVHYIHGAPEARLV